MGNYNLVIIYNICCAIAAQNPPLLRCVIRKTHIYQSSIHGFHNGNYLWLHFFYSIEFFLWRPIIWWMWRRNYSCIDKTYRMSQEAKSSFICEMLPVHKREWPQYDWNLSFTGELIFRWRHPSLIWTDRGPGLQKTGSGF